MNGLFKFTPNSEVKSGQFWTRRNTCQKHDVTTIFSDNVSVLPLTTFFFLSPKKLHHWGIDKIKLAPSFGSPKLNLSPPCNYHRAGLQKPRGCRQPSHSSLAAAVLPATIWTPLPHPSALVCTLPMAYIGIFIPYAWPAQSVPSSCRCGLDPDILGPHYGPPCLILITALAWDIY